MRRFQHSVFSGSSFPLKGKLASLLIFNMMLNIITVTLILTNSSNNSLLSTGQWSDRGCSRNEGLSNVSVTVCECDHLTHFAILLSPAPINASSTVLLSLQVIGYIGVSVSLVAMVATIITFTLLK